MKFLISFVGFDTTIGAVLLGNHYSMSTVQHEIISTDAAEYSSCESVKDVEAAFEGIYNYVYSDDDVTCPESKVKVIKVEALPNG